MLFTFRQVALGNARSVWNKIASYNRLSVRACLLSAQPVGSRESLVFMMQPAKK